ncbi:MAG: hypothetical protein UHC59_10005 [Fibrobacteraceae bacterium]|jgi:hypothetical protein|nr:hypothetical protein [Fibrobacteraceae bacterium]
MTTKFTSKIKIAVVFLTLLFSACSEINSGWEIDGGGYVKYQVNGGDSKQIELHPNDVTLPAYGRHYISLETREEESKYGDRIAFLVAEPTLGKNPIVTNYTWLILQYGPKATAIPESSFVTIDQKDDSTWTGNFNLLFPNCETGTCLENKTVKVTGRFRYWPDPDDD